MKYKAQLHDAHVSKRRNETRGKLTRDFFEGTKYNPAKTHQIYEIPKKKKSPPPATPVSVPQPSVDKDDTSLKLQKASLISISCPQCNQLGTLTEGLPPRTFKINCVNCVTISEQDTPTIRNRQLYIISTALTPHKSSVPAQTPDKMATNRQAIQTTRHTTMGDEAAQDAAQYTQEPRTGSQDAVQ